MRVAQIYKGKIHEIFTADEIPDWPPYPNGEKPLLIDITNRDAEVSYLYDIETDTIIPTSNIPYNVLDSIQNIKTAQLNILRSEPYQIKAESDPEFAERVRLSIEEWENIENQKDYPDNIDWPEMWEETLE